MYVVARHKIIKKIVKYFWFWNFIFVNCTWANPEKRGIKKKINIWFFVTKRCWTKQAKRNKDIKKILKLISEKKLIIDDSVYDTDKNQWVITEPTDQEAYKYWVEIFSVSQDIDTGFLAMEIKHFSPVLTKKWLDEIVVSINEKARFKSITEAENSIEYLKPQFASAELSEVRIILASLIQEQIQTIMLAKSKPEYLFKVIDPPYSPESKSEPKRSVICIIGAFIGLIFSIFIGLLREYLQKQKIV